MDVRRRQREVWSQRLFGVFHQDALEVADTAFTDDRVGPYIEALGRLAVDPEFLEALLDAWPREPAPHSHNPEISRDSRAARLLSLGARAR